MPDDIVVEALANAIRRHLPPGWKTMTSEAQFQYVLGEVELLLPKASNEAHHTETEKVLEFFNRETVEELTLKEVAHQLA